MRGVLMSSMLLSLACGGQVGPEGPQGPPGPAGAGMSLTAKYVCEHGSDAVMHDIYLFSDGSVMTTCTVAFFNYEQSSSFQMYKSGQVGAAVAGCSLYGPGSRWDEFEWTGTLSTKHTRYSGSTPELTEYLSCTKY